MDLQALAIPGAVFGAVSLIAYSATRAAGDGGKLAARLERFTSRPAEPDQSQGEEAAPAASFQLLREQKYSNWALLDQMIARRSWAEREAGELTRGDVPLRVGEYLLLRWILAAGLALLTWLA